MRFPIRISAPWRGLFRLFGFRPEDSYVEIDGTELAIHFGTARERIPLENVDSVEPRRWPFYYGLGPKLDLRGGVAYVGSTDGVVEIRLRAPQPLNVWGPFRRREAHAVTLSLEDAAGFLEAVRGSLPS